MRSVKFRVVDMRQRSTLVVNPMTGAVVAGDLRVDGIDPVEKSADAAAR